MWCRSTGSGPGRWAVLQLDQQAQQAAAPVAELEGAR